MHSTASIASSSSQNVREESESEGEVRELGTPMKVQATAVRFGSPLQQALSQTASQPSRKLELPVKLLRMNAAVQISSCEEDETDLEPPERSTSLPCIGMPSPGWTPWGPSGFTSAVSLSGFDQSFLEMFDESATGGSFAHGGIPLSPGSSFHGTGNCRPCAWFWKPSSCQNLENCSYCHLCPEGELKNRKKNKVAMMRLGIVTPKASRSAESSGQVLQLSSLL